MMNLRFLHISCLALSLALGLCAETSTAPAPAAKLTNPAGLSNNQEKPASPAMAKAVVDEPAIATPFTLKGGMDDFPAKPVESVKVIDGFAAFKRLTTTEKSVAWPIAEYASIEKPKDEATFRQALLSHAAQIGADYVVIITNKNEIISMFPSPLQRLCYCARAYRRVVARIGIESDQAALKDDILKIKGFAPGSHGRAGGLAVGDVVLKIDGEKPGNNVIINHEYGAKTLHWKVGDKVKVEVDRDGKTLELLVELMAG
jgi:hypothetical protein